MVSSRFLLWEGTELGRFKLGAKFTRFQNWEEFKEGQQVLIVGEAQQVSIG
jgi:hypothetical protein